MMRERSDIFLSPLITNKLDIGGRAYDSENDRSTYFHTYNWS